MDMGILSGKSRSAFYERIADCISFVLSSARQGILATLIALLGATASYAQTIALSVDKPNYTAVGEVINFTYTFNSGSSVVTAVTVNSSLFGDFAFCGGFSTSTTGATGTCTRSYTVQNSDIVPNGFVLEAGSFSYDTSTVPGNGGGFSSPGQIRSEYLSPQQPQTISFTQPADTPISSSTVNLSAIATSGLPVDFTSNTTAVCTVSGSTATLLSVGTCTISANQPGDSAFLVAPLVFRTFEVTAGSQAIVFTNPGAQTFVPNGTVALNATGGASGNPVVFTSTTNAVCTVSGSTATMVGAGLCSINANQAGNANFNAAPQVSQSFTIDQASQAIVFASLGAQTFVPNGTVALNATGGASGNPVVFTSTTNAVCTVSGSTATMISAGLCTINANQAGNANFSAAPQISQSFPITQASQVITFVQPANVSFLPGVTVALNATASSGLAVTLTSNSLTVCTVSGTTATILSVGTCSITASQAGNANFFAAASVTRVFSADGDLVATRTQRVISNFLVRRGSRILANDPDLSERLATDPTGDVSQSNLLGFSATGTAYNRSFAVDTSLRKIAGATKASKTKTGIDANIDGGEYGTDRLDQGYDIWVQGKWDHSESGTSEHDLGLLYIGLDYHFSSTFVTGLMAQFDWADEVDIINNTAAEGRGWMVGPYIAARLHDNLIFDGRIAWGRSENEVSPFRTYSDEFKTERWLLKAKLTGDFEKNGWRFMPHVGVSYLAEEQEAYTDTFGVAIPGQNISIGQLTFGPKFSTIVTNDDGSTFEPSFGIKGIWDFDTTELVNLTTGLVQTTDDLRARAEGGVTLRNPINGWSLTADVYYDGIGVRDFSAYGGGLKLTIPLN